MIPNVRSVLLLGTLWMALLGAGVEASIVFVPWTRAESMLRRGEAFAAPVTKTYSRLFFQKSKLDKMNRSIQRLHRSKVYETSAAQAFGER